MKAWNRRSLLGSALAAAALAGVARRSAPGLPAEERDYSKVAISVDMEGISGIVSDPERTVGAPEFAAGRKWLVADVNAAIEGALDAGATKITVHDTHGSAKRNILYDELHPAANLIRGGNQFFWEYDALDRSHGAAFMIGMHAGPLVPALASHYFTSSIRGIRVNGMPIAESHMTAALAAHFGIPTVLVTGDEFVCRMMREWSSGEMVTVQISDSLARNSAITMPLEKTGKLIRAGAREALAKAREVKPLAFDKPLRVELDLAYPEEAKSIALMPSVEQTADLSIAFTAEDALAAHKTLIAALMILTSPVNLARP